MYNNLDSLVGLNNTKSISLILRWNPIIKNELYNKTKFLDEIYLGNKIRTIDRFWCYANNIDSIDKIPDCKICKIKKVAFVGIGFGFRETCGGYCGIKLGGAINSKTEDAKRRAEITKKKVLLEKYGVDHVSKIDFVKKKKMETALKNYGTLKAAFYDTMSKTLQKNEHISNPSESKNVKRKQRKAAIKNLRARKGKFAPNYNPEACKLIEGYGKKHGYNFQHAENGGEFYIKELGYFVDGFDKENNVVIEVDELQHYDRNGNLTIKDFERQKEIENFLKCKFIRVKIG